MTGKDDTHPYARYGTGRLSQPVPRYRRHSALVFHGPSRDGHLMRHAVIGIMLLTLLLLFVAAAEEGQRQ